MTLWVNGALLVRREIEALGPGFAGMMTGTRYEQDHVRVIFDNFQVWGPTDFIIVTNTPIITPSDTPEP